MIYEPITPERLRDYRFKLLELERLLEQKQGLLEKISTLKGIDYSKDKVTTGNGPKQSGQERYAAALERVNEDIDFYKYKVFKCADGSNYGLIKEAEIIKKQLDRIPEEHYKKLLIKRYIENKKFSVITYDFFCGKPDYEDNYLRYHDKIMDWHKSALVRLENISERPYEPARPKQMVLKEKNNEC